MALDKSKYKEYSGSGVPGWLPDEARHRLTQLIFGLGIRTVAEIGTFLGCSAAFFAGMSVIEEVTCIDFFEERTSDPLLTSHRSRLLMEVAPHCLRGMEPNQYFYQFRHYMQVVGVWDKLRVVKGDSHKVVGCVSAVDLVYIDGDHSYDGCLRDIELYSPKAKKVICGDDYNRPAVRDAVTAALPNHSVDGLFWWKVL